MTGNNYSYSGLLDTQTPALEFLKSVFGFSDTSNPKMKDVLLLFIDAEGSETRMPEDADELPNGPGFPFHFGITVLDTREVRRRAGEIERRRTRFTMPQPDQGANLRTEPSRTLKLVAHHFAVRTRPGGPLISYLQNRLTQFWAGAAEGIDFDRFRLRLRNIVAGRRYALVHHGGGNDLNY
jgi:hypothetical protein